MQPSDKFKKLLIGSIIFLLGVISTVLIFFLKEKFNMYSSPLNFSQIRQNIESRMHLNNSFRFSSQQSNQVQRRYTAPINIEEGTKVPIIQSKAIQDKLKELAMNKQDKLLSIEAMSRLIMIGDYPGIRKALANELTVSTWQISLNAATGLAKAGDYSGFETVKKVLKDGEWSAKIDAAKAMGLFGDKGRAVLAKEVDNPDRWIRLGAEAGLARLGDKRAADALAEGLNNFDSAVQVYCAKSLAEIGDQRARGYFEKLFASNDPYIKAEGAKYLYLLGDKQAKDYLINMLQDIDPYWQNYAILALTEK
ncbi:MAG: HEAT repeat domain-containing protein [bacterium]